MHYAMLLVACASIACMAASRSRDVLTEWVPTILMAAGMIAMAIGGAPIASAGLLLVSALLFARGPKRLTSLHRGLASIAMAALTLVHLPVSNAVQTGHHGGLGTSVTVWVLVAACVASAGAVGAVTLIRPPEREDRHGRPANNRFHRTEALVMGAGLIAMAMPMV